MATVRVHATTQAGRFSRGPLSLTPSWSTVDVARPDVRAQLVESVGLHVKVHPHDVPKLAELGLVMADGRLVDLKAKPAAAKATTSAPPATTAETTMPPAAIAAPGSTDRRGQRAART